MVKALEPKHDTSGYYRQIGYKREGSRSQPKIRLGKDKVQATERLARVVQLFMWRREQVAKVECPSHFLYGSKDVWSPLTLEMAKAIGRGERQFVLDLNADEDTDKMLFIMLRNNPVIEVTTAAGAERFEAAEEGIWQKSAARAKATIANADARLRAVGLPPVSGSLHKVLDAHHDHLAKDKKAGDGAISDYGKTLQRQTQALMGFLPDVPLSQLDFEATDDLYRILRQRPKKADGTHYKKKYCQHLIYSLTLALKWCDTSDDYAWELPRKFHRIKTRVDDVEDDNDDPVEIPIFTTDELLMLWQIARPIERLIFALALNCGMGADQVGRLTIDRCLLSDEVGEASYIKARRFKRKVIGRWRLWQSTTTMIRWAIDNRPDTAAANSHRLLVVNQAGNGLYTRTGKGDRSRQIANKWYLLLDRAAKKGLKQFAKGGSRRLSFNSVRDTSTQLVQDIGGETLASVHLAHKHSSADKLLRNYTNPTFKALAKVHRKLEKQLGSLWVAVPDPAENPPRPNSSAFKRSRVD